MSSFICTFKRGVKARVNRLASLQVQSVAFCVLDRLVELAEGAGHQAVGENTFHFALAERTGYPPAIASRIVASVHTGIFTCCRYGANA